MKSPIRSAGLSSHRLYILAAASLLLAATACKKDESEATSTEISTLDSNVLKVSLNQYSVDLANVRVAEKDLINLGVSFTRSNSYGIEIDSGEYALDEEALIKYDTAYMNGTTERRVQLLKDLSIEMGEVLYKYRGSFYVVRGNTTPNLEQLDPTVKSELIKKSKLINEVITDLENSDRAYQSVVNNLVAKIKDSYVAQVNPPESFIITEQGLTDETAEKIELDLDQNLAPNLPFRVDLHEYTKFRIMREIKRYTAYNARDWMAYKYDRDRYYQMSTQVGPKK
jgi:hypothetical protein